MSARWMLYSHDALGLGHVRRSLAIARSVLAAHPDVAALLVTCSPMLDALPLPQGLDTLKLLSMRKIANGSYTPRTLPLRAEQILRLRAAVLRETARALEPDLVLVDKSPGGLMGELRETLALLGSRPRRPCLVLGLRDILDHPSAVLEEWRSARLGELVERHYDEIWVYGDPSFFDIRTAYDLPDSLASRVRYLGYLVPPVEESSRSAVRDRFAVNGPLAVVSPGGGEDGEALIGAYFAALERRLLPRDLQSLVVLGPFMPPGSQERFAAGQPASVTVEPFLADLAPAIAAADVVVSMAGYNTVCELMAARTPAVLIPRTQPRREQWMRARRLEERGLAACLEPERLDPVRLSEAVRQALGRGRPRDSFPATNGLAQVARHVLRLLPECSGEVDGSESLTGSEVA